MCSPLTVYQACLTLEWKGQKKSCTFAVFLLQLPTDVIHVTAGTLAPMENFVMRKLVFYYKRLYCYFYLPVTLVKG